MSHPLFDLALQCHQEGRLPEAIAGYHEVLAINPDLAEAHNNLGAALMAENRLDEALASFQRALSLKPDCAEAHNNLGSLFTAQNRSADAIASFRRALSVKPDYPQACYNLGNALQSQRRLDEAIVCFRRALSLKPEYPGAYNNLGAAFKDQGRLNRAIICFQRALALNPSLAEAHNNLGNAFKEQRRLNKASVCYQRALALNPALAGAHNNLGTIYRDQGRLDEALACFRRALALKPDDVDAINNLGSAFKDQGRLDEALVCFDRALALKPELAEVCSNRVYTLLFHPGYDAKAIARECQRWNALYAEPLKEGIQPHFNDRDPGRRLRIGYVSPNLHFHPVGRFLLPLMEHHDRQNFELVAYAQVQRPDGVTGRFRSMFDVWRPICGLSDERLADQIRQDGIDILVDLVMHMGSNRLLTFARKPAPVQVTWLAYCFTTGLDAIDYRLSDPYLDPPGEDDSFYSEKTVRLPETYWCYQPTGKEPEVNSLPALERGYVTFGSLNNFAKVSGSVLAAWGRILRAVPRSRLILHTSEGAHRQRVLRAMAEGGIAAERIQFAGKVPIAEYCELYSGIDIALDSFPYGGGTTTCDALWMGMPVVSLAGETAVGRGGLSLLSNIGLAELVARSEAEYERIAVKLGKELPRLTELRRRMRQRMQASPLMDAARFTRNMEQAYRTMWRKWCEVSVQSR